MLAQGPTRLGTSLPYESRTLQGALPNKTLNPSEKRLSHRHAKWPAFTPPHWQVFNPPLTGDPHIKQQRRQRAQEIATNQMLSDVPSADVIIVNPTHYAVALKWNRAPGEAPVCVAKGVDEVAKSIRECAHDAGVPIKSDPPTARALHAIVEIGHEVPPDLYRPVATAIRFAEAMRQKAKAFG